jgi:hypothetical protein
MAVSSLVTPRNPAHRHPGIAQQYPGLMPEWWSAIKSAELNAGVLRRNGSGTLLRNSGMTKLKGALGAAQPSVWTFSKVLLQ